MSAGADEHVRARTASVAIPTLGRERELVATITSVLAQDPPADQLLVVDQSPAHDTETERALRALAVAGRIRWIRQPVPNLPMARNTALRASTSDVVIFIDDDVLLDARFVSNHLRNYIDSEVVGVAGRIRQKGPLLPPGRRTTWAIWEDYKYLQLDGTTRVEPIAAFRGCNHSVRRSAILALGGYDENYIGWAFREDTDAALRLWRAGGKIVSDPSAALYHLEATSGGCRIEARTRAPEWIRPFAPTYFALRHEMWHPSGWLDVLVRNVRRYVFMRTNVRRFWRLPYVGASYAYAVARAAQAARCRALADAASGLDAVVLGPTRTRVPRSDAARDGDR